MEVKITATPKELAALAAALQERQEAVVLVRKPYSRTYELRPADGRESAREAK